MKYGKLHINWVGMKHCLVRYEHCLVTYEEFDGVVQGDMKLMERYI